jgi:glycosyltransferase involved in cell wall biosynthesis
VFISDALRQRYLTLLNPQSLISNLYVAPDGVDLRRFAPPMERDEARRLRGLPLDSFLVLYAGGLYAGRGLEELIEAIAGLPAVLVIVGGGEAAVIDRARALAAARGAKVIFAGHLPPAEIPAYLFAADVLAMPYAASLATATGEDTAAWMSPLKMFEYMAAERSIVATDLPALREVLKPEVNALLAVPGSAASIREQVQRLLADPELGRRLARQARQDVEQFTWEARADRILRGLGTMRPGHGGP